MPYENLDDVKRLLLSPDQALLRIYGPKEAPFKPHLGTKKALLRGVSRQIDQYSVVHLSHGPSVREPLRGALFGHNGRYRPRSNFYQYFYRTKNFKKYSCGLPPRKHNDIIHGE